MGTRLAKQRVNYTVAQREGLAVIQALKSYEDMLSGRKVTIIIDHQPLIPLLQQAHQAPGKRLRRWALALTDFDYDIQYTPGKNHYLPDFISRVGMKDTQERGSSEVDDYEPEVGCELLNVETD